MGLGELVRSRLLDEVLGPFWFLPLGLSFPNSLAPWKIQGFCSKEMCLAPCLGPPAIGALSHPFLFWWGGFASP